VSDVDEAPWLRAALREELVALWSDMGQARREAINGVWSIHCESLAQRIKSITALVGPTPWDHIGLALLEDGIYQQLHAEMGVEAPVDMVRVVMTRAMNDSWRTRT
jgi:hypothetical protein